MRQKASMRAWRIAAATGLAALVLGGVRAGTAAAVGGDNNPAVTLPIADPASHTWSSGNAKVASVNAGSGVLTAYRAGTAAISVTSGGLTAWVAVTVSRPRSP